MAFATRRAKTEVSIALRWPAKPRFSICRVTGAYGESGFGRHTLFVALSPKRDTTPPAMTVMTRILKGASSTRTASARECSADLDAQ